MLIYFAGPMFCQAELEFNKNLVTSLERNGFSVFLPQRDGINPKGERFSNFSEKEICQEIFNFDRNELLKADILLMILDGRIPDEGACVELGIAHENKFVNNKEKLLIGYSTDMRVFADIFQINAMLNGALDYIVNNEDDLIEKIKEFQKEQTFIS
ncbi:MAG: nucleoside 2-deoxyribosyltransferase [Anaerolineales bacterium]